MRWLSPESFAGFDSMNKRSSGGILGEVEQRGKWLQQACTTMCFFLAPKHVTSERPIALMLTEVLRALEVAKCQYTYRIEWDATDGRSGGAERTVWVIFLDMERF